MQINNLKPKMNNTNLNSVLKIETLKTKIMEVLIEHKNKIIGFVITIVLAVVIYIIIKHLIGKFKKDKLILTLKKLNSEISSIVPKCEIRHPLDGFNYTISFTIYLEKFYGENYNYWRHIFHKGTPIVDGDLINYEYSNMLYTGWCDLVNNIPIQGPGLWLHPNTNSIRFAINTDNKPGTDKSFIYFSEHIHDPNALNILDESTKAKTVEKKIISVLNKDKNISTEKIMYNSCTEIEYCDIENIDIHTKTRLMFVVNGKQISIYVNDVLTKNCVLLGIPVFNNNSMYFNQQRSAKSYIEDFEYIPYPITK